MQGNLTRLPKKADRSLLVSAADKVHNAEAILWNYRRCGDPPWVRLTGGREGTVLVFSHAGWVAEFAAAHDLACHLTSLVLVDPLTTSTAGLPRIIRKPIALEAVVQSCVSQLIAPCYEFARPHGLQRMASIDDLPHFSLAPLSQPAPERRSLFDRLLGRHAIDIAANAINWGMHAKDFLNKDLSSIPASVLATLHDWAQEEGGQKARGAEETTRPSCRSCALCRMRKFDRSQCEAFCEESAGRN